MLLLTYVTVDCVCCAVRPWQQKKSLVVNDRSNSDTTGTIGLSALSHRTLNVGSGGEWIPCTHWFLLREVDNADGSPGTGTANLRCLAVRACLPSRTSNEDVFIFPAFTTNVDTNLWVFLHQFLKPGIERVGPQLFLPTARRGAHPASSRAQAGQSSDQPPNPKSLAVKLCRCSAKCSLKSS